ncbi:AAA family ATPase [Nesterenkonia alba]|uniref:AAA family ATPase n=1 Tax=Nesterenkonia alba TaxID=515814 RepID=UPI0003B6D9A3|nr:SMC family ATPase [Nesterenkonia alba]
MKFHRLEICAFGPFAGTEVVDFDALSADGLFLLRGPTGSGKTSVLDAITFALYGDVPGERGNDGLKSQHAPVGRQPYVELEFSRGEDRFKVRRIPRYWRPAKRAGAADQQEGPALFLERFEHAGWKSLAVHRIAEGDKELKDILGLDMGEFTKVIMLPQGAFAQLMHASNEERRRILEQLFDISTYEHLEHYLWERKRESEAQLAQLKTQIGVRSAAVQSAAASLLEDRMPAVEDLLPEELATSLLQQGEKVREELQNAAAEAHTAAETRSGEYEELTRRRRQLQRWAEFCQLREAHEAQRPQVETAEQQVTAHRAADAVHLWLRRADEARQQAQQQAEAHAAAEQRAVEALAAQSDVQARTVQDAAQQIPPLLARLTDPETAGLEDEHAAVHTTAQRAGDAAAAAGTEAEQAAQKLAVTEQTLMQLQSQLIGAEETDEALDRAQEAVTAATRQVEQITERDELTTRAATLRRQVAEAADRVENQQEVYQDLSQGHLRSLAYELATQLEPGSPCMVCGSTEHPAPGQQEPDTVTRERVDEAAEKLQQARSRWDTLRDRLKTAEDNLQQARGALGEAADLTAEQAQQQQSQAQEQLTAARKQRIAQRELSQRVDQVREEVNDLREAHTAALHRAEREATEAKRLHAEADRLATRVATLRGDHPTVGARVQALEELLKVVTAAQQAQHQADQAASQAQQRVDEAAASLQESPFDDAEAVTAALLAEEELTRLEELITGFTRTEERLRAQAALDEVQAGKARAEAQEQLPDEDQVESARLRAEEAAAHAQSARDRLTEYTAQLAGLKRGLAELEETLAEHQQQSAAAQREAELAEAVRGTGGDNTKRMRLTTFVLAARLELVTEAASRHLGAMTGGRYQLMLDAERSGRGLRGLDLKVYDEYAEQERPAESLSGGETFMAALSLALGLAETVQAESGGIGLDSLFIDEGFGSLDDQTLDAVMSALHTLQGEGRRIGVVSHVTEMHQQIPTQLRVKTSRAGSTLEMVVPG